MKTTIKSGKKPIKNFMRKIQIENKKLHEILTERGNIFKSIEDINKQIVALDKERTKLGYKMDRLKEKTSPIIDKLSPTFGLQEFEIIARVYINNERMPEVEIVDRLEEYANMLREEAKKNDK